MLRQLDHVVFVVRDLQAAIADYRRRGFTVTPGGEPADALKPPLPFVIEDLTQRELRVPGGAATEHANGASGIAAVVVGTTNIGDTEWRYAVLRERGAPPIELRKADKDGVLDVRFRSG